MKQKLLDVLNSFGYPVYLQGTLGEDEKYPDTFITFWTESTDDNAHYNNGTHSVDWYFTVILYSSSAKIVNELPQEIRKALKGAGFIPQGKGHDVPSDEVTHTGWAMPFLITDFE